MSTILFHEIVFGPIHSRRLGVSLGMNLLPYDGKLCSFDCIYCECGFNKDFRTKTKLPDRENVRAALEDKLLSLRREGITPDVITFAGNGEPTMHPEFKGIIDDTIELRNRYFPDAKISVLTNGMHLNKPEVFEALQKIENPIVKLDSALDKTVRLLDRPNAPGYSVAKQVERYKRFKGDFILQTMFVRGRFEGKEIDNTTEEEISAWLELVRALNPREVMIYTIDRETPAKELEKVPVGDLQKIAARVEGLGIQTNVAG
ncbi:putative Fe-S oxidoreductase [Proteiniphilum saccharofermentans]|uniref:Putative Fe-S oxidoreductase n=1 Tax=Proteiniphilum saccharofermentans TaxID=1642647 RepID=A0A1R3SR26_9BACT|nr:MULTISPECIES: radical SAM protein [Proteiniphilum]MDY9917893.1 radical SAM protein [Proteiniphilum sp.]SCD18876.1 putative Fe-S oxidoreductase [Proteiniphilum saccharofermentans]